MTSCSLLRRLELILAWYPSPAPSPRDRSGSDPFKPLPMTPLPGPVQGDKGGLEHSTTEPAEPPPRQRLTKRTQPRPDVPKAPQPKSTEVEKLGQGRVTITGRRLRCKLCRRELAARQHVLAHEPGHGHAPASIQKIDASARREHTLAQLSPSPDERQDGTATSGDNVARSSSSFDVISGRTEPKLPQLSNLRVSMPPRPSVSPQELTGNMPAGAPLSQEQQPTPARSRSPPLVSSAGCTSYFLEAMSWMAPQLQTGALAGKLICPKKGCSSKLGYFDWSGLPCSCGTWITPAFSLQKAKVDEVPM